VIHFTTHTPTANSLTRSLFEVVQKDTATFSQMLTYIKTDPTLKTGLELLSPRSIMMVPDSIWNRQVFSIDINSIVSEVINSHMFASVVSCDGLRQSAGSDIISLNEKRWRILLNDRDFPCLQYVDETGAVNPDSVACISKCDIVAQNGMVLYLDNILLPPGVATEKPPTAAPTPAPAASNSTAQPTSGLSEDIDIDQCFNLIYTADEDENGSLLRPEYNSLVAAYSETKCQDAPETLSSNQQNVFIDMACLCQERGEGDLCCEGTNAGILLSDDALKKELCQRIDRNAPGNFCNDETESAPSPEIEAEDPLTPPTASPSVKITAQASGAGYSLTRGDHYFLISLVCTAGWLLVLY
jgi:hypothetical protein